MNLFQLQYFVEIAECLNFSQAAQKLSVTQSALSQSVVKMEKELDVSLFVRANRKIELSKYGQCFYRYAKAALSNVESGIDEINNIKLNTWGTVHIASSFGISANLISDIIKNFSEKNPDIPMCVETMRHEDIEKGLKNGLYGWGICNERKNDYYFNVNDYGVIKLGSFPLVIWVSTKNHLAQKELITYADVYNENFFTQISCLKERLLLEPKIYNPLPRKMRLISNENIILNLVIANQGVYANSLFFAKDAEALGIKAVPFNAPPMDYILVWNKKCAFSGSDLAFLEFIKQYAKELTTINAPIVKKD